MPVSDYHQISDVLHVVQQVNPRTVLDIGVGFGKWGMLCREVLDVYNERLQPASWTVRIDGIEIHEPYRNPLWAAVYNHVYIGDVAAMLDSLEHYDLALCCDVIEHLDKDAGLALLRRLLQRASVVLLTSPRGFAPQGASYGNEHQRHLSGWTEADFAGIPHLYKDIGFTFMAVLSADGDRLQSIDINDPLRVLGARRAVIGTAKLVLGRLRQRGSACLSRS